MRAAGHLQPNWGLVNWDALPSVTKPPMAAREALQPGDIVELTMESRGEIEASVLAEVVCRYDGGGFCGEAFDLQKELPRVRVGDTLDFQTRNVVAIFDGTDWLPA